jgi:anti-anti-sigma factor
MEIVEQKSGNVLTLALQGRLDGMTSKGVEQKILALIEGGERRLALDLSGLEYVSSIGLRVLMLAAKRLKAVGGKLAICGLKPAIKKVFDIAGFGSILRIVPTRQDAEKELSAP